MEIRKQKWRMQPEGEKDIEDSSDEGSIAKRYVNPDLCQNCNRIIHKLSKHIGKGGRAEEFDRDSFYKDLAVFQRNQPLKVEDCRLCRIIRMCAPDRFEEGGKYPRVANLNLRGAWGMEKVWKMEFGESSSLPMTFAAVYLLPVLDEPLATKVATSWVSNGDTMNYANKWLSECVEDHDCRNENTGSLIPTRLIDVGTSSSDIPRLREHSEIPLPARYATLSHCWGTHIPVKLLQSNIDILKKGIDFTSLSKTFQEAIIAARHLRIQYIWIDSLCIIQDSSTDWSEESGRMCDVYSSSFINFAAASGTDGRQGLFFPHSSHHEDDTRAEFDIGGLKYRIVDRDYWDNTIEQLPLLTRAWVYQERLLAPRNLYFGRNELVWECDRHQLSEVFPVKMPDFEDGDATRRLNSWFSQEKTQNWNYQSSPEEGKSQKLEEIYKRWASVVNKYSRGSLTFPTDKLVALSGIAEKFRSLLNTDTYLAGLWRGDLRNQLLWHVAPGSKALPQSYIAPSWSWASILGSEISFHTIPARDHDHTQEHLVEILDAQTIPLAQNPLGQLKEGCYIKARAPLCRASVAFHPEKPHCGCCDRIDAYEFDINFSGAIWPVDELNFGRKNAPPAIFHPDVTFQGLESGTKVEDLYCLPIRKDVFWFGEGKQNYACWITGLLLQRIGEGGAFRRWGLWKVSQTEAKGGLGGLTGAFTAFDEGRERSGLLFEGDGKGGFVYDVKIV